jgi:hypothetical protein
LVAEWQYGRQRFSRPDCPRVRHSCDERIPSLEGTQKGSLLYVALFYLNPIHPLTDLIILSGNLAPSTPSSCLGRLRGFYPPLGPRHTRTHVRPAHLSTSRHPIPGTRLKRLVPCVPPPRPSPCQRFERPHHALLVPRTPRRCIVCLLWRRREATRND